MWGHTSAQATSLLESGAVGRTRLDALHAVASFQSATDPTGVAAMAEAAELLASEAEDYAKGRADHSFLEAVLSLHYYDWIGAQEQLWNAINLYQHCHDMEGVFATSVLLANGSALEGRFGDALRSLEAVMELDEIYGCTAQFPEERLATIFYDLGSTMFELGLYQQALHRLNQARELAARTGARQACVGAPFVLARIEASEGNRAQALVLQQEAVDACLETETTWRHLSLMQLAELHLGDGNAELARATLDAAEALGSSLPHSLAHVRVEMARAELHLQQGDAAAARAAADRAVKFLAPTGHRKLVDGLELLARAQTAVGNDKEASELWRESATIARHRSPTRAAQRSLAEINHLTLPFGTPEGEATNLMIRQYSVAKAQLRVALDKQASLAVSLGHDARIVITNAQLLLERHLARRPDDAEIRSVISLLDALTDLITTTTSSWGQRGPVGGDTCDPRACVAESLDLVAPSLTQRGLGVSQVIEARVGRVHLPHAILRNALTNLLANAIEHSFSDDDIAVHVVKKGSRVVISVIDTGVGVNEGRLAGLNDASESSQTTQRGLGLRQTRSQLAEFGSDLVLSSAGPGHGLRADVEVRVVEPEADAEAAEHAELGEQGNQGPD